MKRKTVISFVTVFVLVTFLTAKAQVPSVPSFTVSRLVVRQGEILVVTLSPYARQPRVALRIFNQNLEPNNRGTIYVGVDPELKPREYSAYLIDAGTGLKTDWYQQEIVVQKRNFKEIKIKGKKPSLPISPEQRQKETAAIKRAYEQGKRQEDYAMEEYENPLDHLFVTKEFYLKRIFSDGLNIHRGVDLRAPLGAPVKAIGSGKVVLVAPFFSLEGNLVILDHGSGIFSLYLHLSQIKVRSDQMVKKGEIIGLAGDNGLGVTGPHLHLAVKVNGVNVNPLEFIRLMKN